MDCISVLNVEIDQVDRLAKSKFKLGTDLFANLYVHWNGSRFAFDLFDSSAGGPSKYLTMNNPNNPN